MNSLYDLRKVWSRLQHEKVAKWTLMIHIIYYGHASIAHYLPSFDLPSVHLFTSAACAVILTLELVSTKKERRHVLPARK